MFYIREYKLRVRDRLGSGEGRVRGRGRLLYITVDHSVHIDIQGVFSEFAYVEHGRLPYICTAQIFPRCWQKK